MSCVRCDDGTIFQHVPHGTVSYRRPTGILGTHPATATILDVSVVHSYSGTIFLSSHRAMTILLHSRTGAITCATQPVPFSSNLILTEATDFLMTEDNKNLRVEN